MRFLREMIVRRGQGDLPGQAPDEPPVKDFFELSPMRERLARSRAADPGADRAEDDGGAIADMVAARLGGESAEPTLRPRRPAPVVSDGDLADLEFGAFDDDEIDAFDLDAATPDAAEAAPDAPAHTYNPQLARRPMTAPRDERLAEAQAAWLADEDEPDTLDDLTDDPALAALVASRRAVEPAPAEPTSAPGNDAPALPDAAGQPDTTDAAHAFGQTGATDDDMILAGIAAALPPVARPTPVAAPEAAPRVAAAPPPAAAPGSRAPRIWDIEAEAQETAVMRFAETAAPPQPASATRAAPEAGASLSAGHDAVGPAAVAAAAAAASLPARDTLAPEPLRTDPPRKSGRVRTRLLGFHAAEDTVPDPLAAPSAAPVAGPIRYPVGWVVVVEGPGRGASFTLRAGVSPIGRDEDQTIQLDFGDTAISRQMHAAIAYDEESRGFFLGHGGKSNIVRLNGRPVLSTEDLTDGDVIRIGETTLKFVAFCGRDFDWSADQAAPQDGERADARG